ncbi:vascular endothelial growth factor A [Tetranychus urticae]|uniref:Platelet-derived growth factor (PDGF) family profile domain-containing protein n=1 Tax=Tetranychus urticae TaxID=32264 RepID=T1KJZ9_TETUR|nr:vascular endothelial growth factor A [Tetranychus urticae]
MFNLIILLLTIHCTFSARLSEPTSSSSGSSGAIVFPSAQRPQSQQNSFDIALLRTAGLRNVSDIFAALGIHEENEDPLAGRKKTNYAEQAVCEPELRTVEVGDQRTESGEIFFPRCVRVLRCGGCCDISDRMACTPTKISHRDVKRAKIRLRRSTTPSASSQTIQVEVHDECRCMCKVKEEHCNPSLHVYQADLCKCACNNEQDAVACRNMAPAKSWDNNECKCKCRDVKHCPSGTEFSHDTCNCEAS